jgi:hypothetical protein
MGAHVVGDRITLPGLGTYEAAPEHDACGGCAGNVLHPGGSVCMELPAGCADARIIWVRVPSASRVGELQRCGSCRSEAMAHAKYGVGTTGPTMQIKSPDGDPTGPDLPLAQPVPPTSESKLYKPAHGGYPGEVRST